MQIEFVRHTETNYNVLHLLNDIPHDKVYLTEKGIRDAGKLANNLKTFPAKKIYTSEFPRCKEVAEIINKNLKVPVIVDERIGEIKTGMDGQSSALLREMKHSMKPMPGVERPSSIRNRLIEFLKELDEDCVVVTHLAVMKVLDGTVKGLSDNAILQNEERISRITLTDSELRKILK